MSGAPSCKAKLCNGPVSEIGAASGLNLCQHHLDLYVKKHFEDKKNEWHEKLKFVQDTADQEMLEMELQCLTTEVRDLEGRFDALQARLQQLRAQTLSRVRGASELAAECLRDATQAEESERELFGAFDTGDIRRLLELDESMDLWLDEAHQRSKVFWKARTNLRNQQSLCGSRLNVRPVGDVAAGVQGLQLLIDRHMAAVMRQCWLDDAEATSTDEADVCRPAGSIENLRGRPSYLASCTNTAGFAGDEVSGRVVRAQPTAADRRLLPREAVIVAFDGEDGGEQNLLLTSLDGMVRYFVHYNLAGTEGMTGLHCDSERQLLFAAQFDAVTIMDLSGQRTQVISANTLNQPVEFRSIAGNLDQLFAVSTAAGKVLGIDKESRQIQSAVSISMLSSPIARVHGLCVSGSKLLLADFEAGHVHRVCSTSGHLISTLPARRSDVEKFLGPWQVAVDSRGVVIVSEFGGHTVRLMTCDGVILQTLGSAVADGSSQEFNHPEGLALVTSGDCTTLVVSDAGNSRLRVYRML